MTTSSKRRTFGINQFFRRQTNDSKYSHFSGTDEELLSAIEQNFPLREKGRYEGAWLISLPGTIGNSNFYTPVLQTHPRMFLNAECLSRSATEVPLVCATGVGTKKTARYAEAILYSSELLKRLGPSSTNCDFELISLQASDVQHQPEHPYEIARAVLENGEQYDPKAICRAILYWGQHVYCKPRFTRHVDTRIAEYVRQGEVEKAAKLRREQVPDETMEEAAEYVDAIQRFLDITGKFYV